MEPASYLYFAHLVDHEAQLVTEVRRQDALDLLLQADIAGFETMENQVPVSDLILTVLAQDFKLGERVVENSVPSQNVKTCIQIVY